MAEDTRGIEWAKKIQAIAQAGLTYTQNVYDVERYEQLRALSVEMMAAYSGLEIERVAGLFANEIGYATPKVDVRGVVIQDGRVLLVKEVNDGCWSLPGGWADIGLSPRENVVKEIKEESGYEVTPVRLLAALDRNLHAHTPLAYHVYKLFIQCELIGGEPQASVETSEIGFFGEDELPPLSVDRVTESQMRMLFKRVRESAAETIFD
ncbi:NUDIX hydrolase [Paenibacillus radicis (ex Xue et al. 2023)]|uniref:NUDIX hydrolase n=1 Tax=Paenibacillus radicis (ex Xue et al. 2023) TaxID=2972489 RepID=A0ABT1YRZ2_9BACL|nr:NUDIX hydrolase [Paenibacillus radicis (ex Xue et al. 2023)]MCR8635510.1 NUDIX hydrolase [Paenibacillus radicis (ex Xue et al. 2023)]